MFEFLNYFYNIFLYNTLFLNLILLNYYGNNEFLLNNAYNLIKKSGVVGIKFCQWFIYNKRLTSDDPRLDRFEDFYERCSFHSIEDTKKIFYRDFGIPINNYLEFISDIPIASGSIGQVYKCKLLYNNKIIALKVKHPNIEYQVHYPIFIMNLINNFLNVFFPNHQLPLNINQFFKILKEQLNFNIEYHNAKHMERLFKKNDLIVIPEPILSSDNIYISEFVDGEYFENYNNLSHYKKCKIALAFILINRQLLSINGFMHADLHKGNWKVKINKNDSKKFKIILYDFGFCFSINPNYVNNLWLGWEILNKEIMAKTFLEIIKQDNPNLDLDYFYEKLILILNDILKKPIDFSVIIKKIYSYLIQEKVILTGTVINFFIIVILLDKIIKNYNLVDNGNYEKSLTIEGLSENYFKTDYLNYINFCDYYNAFDEVKFFLKDKLKKYSNIDDLFYGINKEKILIDYSKKDKKDSVVIEI